MMIYFAITAIFITDILVFVSSSRKIKELTNQIKEQKRILERRVNIEDLERLLGAWKRRRMTAVFLFIVTSIYVIANLLVAQ